LNSIYSLSQKEADQRERRQKKRKKIKMTQKKEQGKEAHKDGRNRPAFHPGGV
jgi:hypothetical protein